jgi:FdhD protein
MASIFSTSVLKISNHITTEADDFLAIEEPLEIRLSYVKNSIRQEKNISITMRTPSDDEDLAIGFLFTEGIITNFNQVQSVSSFQENSILIELFPDAAVDLSKLERNFYTTSSCGICGKASIEAIEIVAQDFPKTEKIIYRSSFLLKLPESLQKKQSVFKQTGGLHASAIFNKAGDIVLLREDVGRHNALDKVIGAACKQNMLPLSDALLLLSGRASFELIQKAKMANIKTVAAVGAPSSLAVALAKESDMTLIGFLRNDRFNIYCGNERVLPD